MNIKVLSWNIWIDGDFEGISKFLKDQNADIVALQEVIQGDKEFDVIGFLESLGYHYVYGPSMKITWESKRSGELGNAIFSKFPILNSKVHDLSETNNRIVVEARIKTGNGELNVFCTHLIHTHQLPSETQDSQAQNLIRVLTREKTVLAGDFNASPDSNAIQAVSKALVETDPKLTPTWSNYPEGCQECGPDKLKYKLDYIFISPDIKLKSFKVKGSPASDHLPIIAEVEV